MIDHRSARRLVIVCALLLVTVPLKGCSETLFLKRFTATLEVDGKRYTDEVVLRARRSLVNGKTGSSTHGQAFTFRLDDNRVVMFRSGGGRAGNWTCAIESNRNLPECEGDWRKRGFRADEPDGYIFNDADNPTDVVAFQFPPASPEFPRSYDVKSIRYDGLVISTDVRSIELVDYQSEPVWLESPRDTVDEKFYGAFQEVGVAGRPPQDKYRYTKRDTKLSAAAMRLGLMPR